MLICSSATADNNDSDVFTITPTYKQEELDSMKMHFIREGNPKAYLRYLFYSKNRKDRFIYTFYMANTYYYSYAQFQLYEMIKEFYNEFEPSVKNAFSEMPKKEAEQTGEACPDCGSPLVIRSGRYGEFVACSNYPECKYIKKEEVEITEICGCPNCSGNIIEKKSRRGKVFYGCDKYPKCKTAYWYKPINRKCPECGEMLLDKNNTTLCSSCEYTE
jgi:DNA topoisomerase-1